MVPKGRPAGQAYEVRSFATYRDSVIAYVHNLNTGDAYRELRGIREQERKRLSGPKGVELAEGLTRYSTRGEDYVQEIQSMIRFNKLDRFDDLASACSHTEMDHRC
jgi:Bax protein